VAFIVSVWRRRPRRSFVAGFFSAADVPGPHQAVIAAWPELLIPATLLGFVHTLRSIAPLHALSASFDVSFPLAVSPATVREFLHRGIRFLGRITGLRPQLLGLTTRSSRTVRSVGPAMAFTHRADQIHQPLLPWA